MNVTHSAHASEHTVQSHALERQQQNRWALLLRVHITPDGSMQLTVLSERPNVTSMASYAMARLLRSLLDAQDAGAFRLLAELDSVLEHAGFVAGQVAPTPVSKYS